MSECVPEDELGSAVLQPNSLYILNKHLQSKQVNVNRSSCSLEFMRHPASEPHSLYEVFNFYIEAIRATEPEKKAYAKIAQLQTVLLRYLLPEWGETVSKGSKQEKLECLKFITLEQLYQAPQAQEQYLARLDLSDGSKRTQRYILRLFLKWCESQSWWNPSVPVNTTGQKKKTSSSARHIRVSDRPTRKPYGLKSIYGKGIPTNLQQELDSFYRFRTSPPDEILARPVKPNSAKKELAVIDALMGWLHSYEGVAIEDLSLNCLTIDIVHHYKYWLQQNSASEFSECREGSSQSLSMVVMAIKVLIAVAKYKHYVLKRETKRYKETPIAEALRLELKLATEEIYSFPSPIDQSKKWLNWIDFLQLVEVLRTECEADKPHASCSLTAIAQSYQRFLMVALLAYLPLLPPQTIRLLRLLPKTEQPQVLNNTDSNSYLYQRDGAWWIQIFSSKPNQPAFLSKIPNIQYSEGLTFYQYLEAWLCCYSNLHLSTIHEAGTGLRDYFHPQHSYVFSKTNGSFYEYATEFGKVVRNAAYRLSGKALTPKLIREMFIEYIVKGENIDSKIYHNLIIKYHNASNFKQICDSAILTEDNKTLLDIAQEIAQSVVNDD